MKNSFKLLVLSSCIISCTPSINFEKAEELTNLIESNSKIYRFSINENTTTINGKEIITNEEDIGYVKEKGLMFESKRDNLQELEMSIEDLESFFFIFENTKAYSVDFKDGKAYFIVDSFLDNSKGYLYSKEELNTDKSSIKLNDGNIKVLDKIRPNWYKATAWH
ncbi:hypothetical protein [Nonlabens ponticola]|uniref:Uncharacterized protein n=1 Tax=Nonlabens ponticola TaxID=2496866 RepID=A0A3S9MYU7_9FLAO|nr:hypothetical protein [Nonlabens ponticola]AZQ44431.1 hypothetical protein EJ995_09315 [Nonlabens ponticola]